MGKQGRCVKDRYQPLWVWGSYDHCRKEWWQWRMEHCPHLESFIWKPFLECLVWCWSGEETFIIQETAGWYKWSWQPFAKLINAIFILLLLITIILRFLLKGKKNSNLCKINRSSKMSLFLHLGWSVLILCKFEFFFPFL